MFWILLAVAAGCAAADWFAVHTANRGLEYVFKPATLAVLIAAAATIDADHRAVKAWFVAALVFSLFGDIFLMLPSDQFVPGLASFLLGHLAYIAGLNQVDLEAGWLVAGVAVVAITAVAVAPRIVRGAYQADRALAGPVMAYIAAISAMVVFAFGSANGWAIAGALLFYVSDALIGWTRFLKDYDWGRLAIIVTYHLGQAGLVLSLL